MRCIEIIMSKQTKEMSRSYKKWWEAFRVLGETLQRGWQKDLAEKLGYSTKHINMIFSGKARASIELQEQISDYIGVPYHKMIEYGKEILKVLEEIKFFPRYYEVLALPPNKRFDKMIEIAKEETGCPYVVFEDTLRRKYNMGEVSEEEAYKEIKKHMLIVKRAVEKVDGPSS